VKLDPFHWLKRWNEILVEPNKEQAGVFRAMMSRALFNATEEEYSRAKEKLQAKKKFANGQPTNKDIMKEA
jgi:hypothetical protein